MIKSRFIIYGQETHKPIVDIKGDIRQVSKEVIQWTTALGFLNIDVPLEKLWEKKE